MIIKMGKLNRTIPLCACGCWQHVKWNVQKKCWNRFIFGHQSSINIKVKPEAQLCECQCGLFAKPGNRFIAGHNKKYFGKTIAKKIIEPQLCECKCGGYAKTGRRFIYHHNSRIYIKVKPEPQLCACNVCGLYAEPGNRFIHGHNGQGTHQSAEAIEKHRIAAIGVHPSAESIEKMRQAKLGTTMTEETTKEMSLSQVKAWQLNPDRAKKSSERFSGAGNPGYIDGRCSDNDPYPVDFNGRLKELIRDRDGRRCRLCTKSEEENGRKLPVHHINYDKENLDPHNLISLCSSCHGKTCTYHSKWISFFQGPQRILEIMNGERS